VVPLKIAELARSLPQLSYLLISDILALWRSALSTRVTASEIKNVG